MEMMASQRRTRVGVGRPPVEIEDPLDPDQAGDLVVASTWRALTRLALVATEAGARFQREEVGHDPMAWMLAPRRLFGGRSALEACLEREGCLRAVLLHGLALGLDAEPAAVDALLLDDAGAPGGGFWDGGDRGREDRGFRQVRRQRLYSAMLVFARGGELVHIFHASVASTPGVVRERIRSRFGAVPAQQAEIRVGVDLGCPVTAGMVPPVFREMIENGRRVRWSSMSGLDVTVEHRIPS